MVFIPYQIVHPIFKLLNSKINDIKYIKSVERMNLHMDASTLVAVLGAILGTGGITAVITSILSARKYRAEAAKIEQETEQRTHEYIRSQIIELSETHKRESEELRRQNKDLNNKINELNDKLRELMIWVMNENYAHISFLKDKIREFDPDFVFPEMKPCPNPWKHDDAEFKQFSDITKSHETSES